MMLPRRLSLGLGVMGAALLLAACDPDAQPSSSSVYYDSLLWNDYYYGCPGCPPPGYRPAPPRPPIGTVPPRPTPPIHRPRPTPLPARH
ncbi:hypothetical protein [Jhaorihella thermophila]|uniref:Lipoprotein n=1 Tax=Jhaorihella thermophila TaxID=488547 RepID=A0A1H5WJJ0_9RHOB|nr:hypothetical protein [Jhaorihella thermophila]SEF99513.1 hypothetical protein SAMN05421751_10863 [Jhaorihella thermophila]